MAFNKSRLRALVGVYYDVQEVRISADHRIRKAGEHGLTEDGVAALMDWVDTRMEKQETELKTMVMREIRDEQIWTEWLVGVKGVGPCITGGLLAWVGYCETFETVSKVWKFCGMDVKDGIAPRRQRGVKLTFNPALRTLCWKAGESFVKQGDGYRDLYLAEKTRLHGLYPEPAPYDPPRLKKDKSPLLRHTDGHLHAMAKRKVVKVFLSHYWQTARRMRDLPIREVYALEQLGHTTPIPVVMH